MQINPVKYTSRSDKALDIPYLTNRNLMIYMHQLHSPHYLSVHPSSVSLHWGIKDIKLHLFGLLSLFFLAPRVLNRQTPDVQIIANGNNDINLHIQSASQLSNGRGIDNIPQSSHKHQSPSPTYKTHKQPDIHHRQAQTAIRYQYVSATRAQNCQIRHRPMAISKHCRRGSPT